MRLLILGSLGPYPERITTFTQEGHQIWYVCTEQFIPPTVYSLNIRTSHFQEPGTSLSDAVAQLVQTILKEQFDAVYSLLNVWDGSNWATAKLLEYGCPVPVIRHYKEHYLSPADDERRCL